MKNSSSASSPFVRAGSAAVLFSASGLLEGLGPVLPASVPPSEPHVSDDTRRFVCVPGKQSLNSLASSSTAEAPTAAGLSDCKVTEKSNEAERAITLTAVSERGGTGAPVSTLVSGSSSSSSRRRWEREWAMEGRRGESGWVEVESGAGLLRWDE